MSWRKWHPFNRAPRKRTEDPFSTATAKAMTAVLIDLGLLDEDERVRIRRVYAGRHQRSEGAWSWWAEDQDGNEVCGSQFTAREIIRAHKSKGRCVSIYESVGTNSLFPETGEICSHDNLIRPGKDGPCGCRVIPD